MPDSLKLNVEEKEMLSDTTQANTMTPGTVHTTPLIYNAANVPDIQQLQNSLHDSQTHSQHPQQVSIHKNCHI